MPTINLGKYKFKFKASCCGAVFFSSNGRQKDFDECPYCGVKQYHAHEHPYEPRYTIKRF